MTMLEISKASRARAGSAAAAGAVRLGAWPGLVVAVLAAASLATALTTPPRSGPFAAAAGRIVYPYTAGTGAFVPRDYLWMIAAMLVAAAFVVFTACARQRGASGGSAGTVALCFASIAAAVLTADYFIQLHVLQPMLARGEVSGLAMWSQYNPHGAFVALEELGYLAMWVAFLSLAIGLGVRAGRERVLARVLLTGAAVGFAAFALLSVAFGLSLEYRFECAAVVIDWATLLVAGSVWAATARRRARLEA